MRIGEASFSALLPLLLFFLVASLPSGSAGHVDVKKERTLAMIKPDGLHGNYTDKIKDIILESGYNILKEIMVHLDEGNVTLFYAEHSEKSFFPRLIEYMTSGPVIVMVLEKSNAISDWRALIGPTDPRKAKISHPNSIRAMCGIDIERNCVHGSDSSQSASKEIKFFFGEMVLSGFSDDDLQHDEL
uniref:Nucleoside diphosphate kinase, mitochondrial n=1 Tax=Anthurium amnicola TaxID=1678845 RepID=A0A1D1YI59_9ARAE